MNSSCLTSTRTLKLNTSLSLSVVCAFVPHKQETRRRGQRPNVPEPGQTSERLFKKCSNRCRQERKAPVLVLGCEFGSPKLPG